MLRSLGRVPLCTSCSRQLFDLFVGGLSSTPARAAALHGRSARRLLPQRHPYHSTRSVRQGDQSEKPQAEVTVPSGEALNQDTFRLEDEIDTESSPEERVLLARETFGNTLPEGYLNVEEYRIYERLYGSPTAITTPEDEKLLKRLEEEEEPTMEELGEENTLFKETDTGELEEVEYGRIDVTATDTFNINELLAPIEGESMEAFEQRKALYESVANAQGGSGSLDGKNAMLRDLQSVEAKARQELAERKDEDMNPEVVDSQYMPDGTDHDEVSLERSHILSEVGRFRTYPATVQIPAVDFTEPIQKQLATTARYDHLSEHAAASLGGRHLPDSNATPRSKRFPLQQKPVKLSAAHYHMSQMDANLFMSTIMPGAYATAKSILMEVRRRLGPKWLEDAVQRPGGPRILDAGAGGAGVIAWRELLAAQWDLMHEENISQGDVPIGKSTVLAGSDELRNSVSRLLGETSFVPRLPDFNRLRDMPAERDSSEPARKQYDIIIAPYTLFGMEEDYVRKAHVQNLWSLLDPDGGVLILFEKGVPKGFEAVAAARDILLKHHLRNPDPENQEQVQPIIGNFHTNLEDGMIIAPCTNHKQCPMYTFPGESVGRKDFCRFRQRYERPPFLQRIYGAKFNNFEDIDYSYIAVQRGRDMRKESGFAQNEQATTNAFTGYENHHIDDVAMQTLPRIIAQPLKRTGHVTFSMCTPSGKLEKWITPKSFSRQAYRDARKSTWGDLWALGAKTRIDAPAKVGKPKNERWQFSSSINHETGEPFTPEEKSEFKQMRRDMRGNTSARKTVTNRRRSRDERYAQKALAEAEGEANL